MFLSRRNLIALALTITTAFALLGYGARQADAAPAETQRYDVVMNGLSFSYEGDMNPNGAPVAGTPFVVTGYVYPGGTLAQHGELSGVLANGDPEFPNLVLGTWHCSGWHLQDGDAPTGPVVVTTQVFDFDLQNPGSQTVVTSGIELADFGVPFQRAVVGTSGNVGKVSTEISQMYVGDGLNVTGGFNTVFAF